MSIGRVKYFLFQTYLCLGENGLESENYSIAVEDIKQALELQKVHLLEYDRRIAETYYQLGVAYSLAQVQITFFHIYIFETVF